MSSVSGWGNPRILPRRICSRVGWGSAAPAVVRGMTPRADTMLKMVIVRIDGSPENTDACKRNCGKPIEKQCDES
jgi:hypothetical protein